MKTRQLSVDAMLAAMVAVLGFIAIDLTAVKITFESVPIIIAALMFGPVDGMMVGFAGTAVYQLLRYGISVTTPLWILPYVLIGLFLGLSARRRNFEMSRKETLILVIANELLVTLLNTGTMYVDSKIFHYWFPGFISAALTLRIVLCVVKAAAYAFLLPPLIKEIRKALKLDKKTEIKKPVPEEEQ